MKRKKIRKKRNFLMLFDKIENEKNDFYLFVQKSEKKKEN